MSDLEKFKEVVDDVWKMVFGTERRQNEEPEYTNVDKGFTKEQVKEWKKFAKITDLSKFEGMYTDKKPKRARTEKGYYKADDKSTPDVNEAWENE